MIHIVVVLVAVLTAVSAKVYFKENFNDAAWIDRWTVPSQWKPQSELGKWKHTAGEYSGDPSDKGIQIGEALRFYSLSAKMDSAFTNRDKEFVIQMSVKHEQTTSCGGAYIKLLGDTDQSTFGGHTPFQVMFGPDMCSDWKTLVAFNHSPNNEILHIKDQVKVESDFLTHLYTLVVKPDNTFEVLIDLESVKSGTLAGNWDFPPSHHPQETNLDGYPIYPISESSAAVDEKADLHVRCIDCTHIGLEFWHSSAGTLFDDILVTDSFEEAKAYAQETFLRKQGPEKKAYEERVQQFSCGDIVLQAAPFDSEGHRKDLYVSPRDSLKKPDPACVRMDPATVSKLDLIDTTAKAKPAQVIIPISNPLNGVSILWAPLIFVDAERNVMDSRSASLLGLKPGYECTEGYYKGWLSVIELSILGKSVETAVCVVRNSGNSILGRPLMAKYDLCYCPARGFVECSTAVPAFEPTVFVPI